MFDLDSVIKKLAQIMREKGIDTYSLTATESKQRELNTENTDYVLYRTIFDGKAVVTVMIDSRKGTAAGNDLSDDGIYALALDAIKSAESAVPDEANVLAEAQTSEVFFSGDREGDMDSFCDRITEFMDDIKRDYPMIRILQVIADHRNNHTIYYNSNGTRFESVDGCYHLSLEMSASDGKLSTGLDYLSLSTQDIVTPFIRQGGIAAHLADTQASLHRTDTPDKFEGTIILTPDCLMEFVYMLLSNYMMSEVIMSGTSRWLDRIGEQVASPLVSMSLKAHDDRLAEIEHFSADGYKAEDVQLLENGVLKNHILSLYAAKKTGRPVTKNGGFSLVVEAGSTPLSQMIASIGKGLIVGGFSGGEPGPNGEFSGVAKNSFLVEDGKIKGSVSETMINGNLEELFRNVVAVSCEQISNGNQVLPYLACSGVIVSGK